MARIKPSLSMYPLYPTRCVNCKKYKSSLANLTSIIQEQNKTIDDLKKQLHFKDKLYKEQNQRLKRTQEHFLCPICLWHFKQPDHSFELCQECSIALPK